ncbi:MAG: hypothetical protein HC842_00170 [Cytophagales bacterium]|nr:hypothetical protein [Cytophagales bacterium]
MPILSLLLGIAFLLLLMLVLRMNAFISLLLTALVVGLANGLGPMLSLQSVLQGMGSTMGDLVLVLVFGAMLGKLVEESGAAHAITHRLTAWFGPGRIQYAILATGFLVGIPMMYNASFLVLIPLIYALSSVARLPLLYLGIPLSATLSIAHAYLPPHPAPTAVAQLYGADINRVLLYGLVPCLPAMLVAGIWLSRFLRTWR